MFTMCRAPVRHGGFMGVSDVVSVPKKLGVQ